MSTLAGVILRGDRASQPAVGAVPVGSLYCVTDEDDIVERNSGVAWESYSPAAGSGGITQLTGDVTAGPGTGSVAATIAIEAVTTAKILDEAVTYAKIQDISATSRILGRKTAAAGPTEEINPVNFITKTIGITIDGGGSQITTGVKGFIRIPVTGTLTGWTLLADQSGAIKIDVWKDVFANYPPDNSDSITNGHEPEIPASGTNAEDTNISDWTSVAVTAGDVIGFNVDSCTSITRATLELTLLVTLA